MDEKQVSKPNNSNLDIDHYSPGSTGHTEGYRTLPEFKYWVQTVLPQVYDDALSYQELLYKVVGYLNIMNDNNNLMSEDVKTFVVQFNEMVGKVNGEFDKTEDYINQYFNDLDVTQEIENKLSAMANNGTFNRLWDNKMKTWVEGKSSAITSNWLNTNISGSSQVIIDSSLTVPGACADAKAVGDKTVSNGGGNSIDANGSINDILKASVNTFNYAVGSTAIPSGFPFRKWIYNRGAVLITTGGYNLMQVLIGVVGTNQRLTVYTRIASRPQADMWGTWYEGDTISTGNLTANDNVNDILTPGLHVLNFALNATAIPSGLPFDSFPFNQGAMLITAMGSVPMQILIGFYNRTGNVSQTVYTRLASKKNAENWLTWVKIPSVEGGANDRLANTDSIDTLTSAGIYPFNYAPNTTDFPSGFPFRNWIFNRGAVLITTSGYNPMQLLIGITVADQTLKVYTRIATKPQADSWMAWNDATSIGEPIPSGSANEVITIKSNQSLVQAIKDNQDRPVDFHFEGEHDLKAEYEAVYGATYFDTYTDYFGTDKMSRGLNLTNGQSLIGNNKSKIVFNYDGTNEGVLTYFTPVNLTDNNKIKDFTIEARGCRYAIHDDFSDGIESTTEYDGIECNLNSSTARPLGNCIGIGSGSYNTTIVKNCIFTGDRRGFYYHHFAGSNGRGFAVIKDNYFDGPIRIDCVGQEPLKSNVMISNNVTTLLVYKRHATAVDNMNVMCWNNVNKAGTVITLDNQVG